jgi:hypothetical protein
MNLVTSNWEWDEEGLVTPRPYLPEHPKGDASVLGQLEDITEGSGGGAGLRLRAVMRHERWLADEVACCPRSSRECRRELYLYRRAGHQSRQCG